MIKCKQAMESSACGKVCCCLECEERESCKDVCTELSPDCEDAFNEETALATMQTEAAAIIKGIAVLTLQKKQIEEQEKEMEIGRDEDGGPVMGMGTVRVPQPFDVSRCTLYLWGMEE